MEGPLAARAMDRARQVEIQRDRDGAAAREIERGHRHQLAIGHGYRDMSPVRKDALDGVDGDPELCVLPGRRAVEGQELCHISKADEVEPLALPAFARWTWMSEKTTFRCCQLSGVALTAILTVPVAYVASDATAMMASSAATAKANARRGITAVHLSEHDSPGGLYRFSLPIDVDNEEIRRGHAAAIGAAIPRASYTWSIASRARRSSSVLTRIFPLSYKVNSGSPSRMSITLTSLTRQPAPRSRSAAPGRSTRAGFLRVEMNAVAVRHGLSR